MLGDIKTFPKDYECASYVNLVKKMKTTPFGAALPFWTDLLRCSHSYVSTPKFINTDYNDRTLMLFGAPSLELEPETQLRFMCDSARIIPSMYDIQLSHVA